MHVHVYTHTRTGPFSFQYCKCLSGTQGKQPPHSQIPLQPLPAAGLPLSSEVHLTAFEMSARPTKSPT